MKFILLIMWPLVGSLAPLRRALMISKPIVVEIKIDEPESVLHLDVEDLSARLRYAGAAALVAPSQLVKLVTEEQGVARGDFPGPLPVLCEVNLCQHDNIASFVNFAQDMASAGAAGIAVHCMGAADADLLCRLLEIASAAGLESLVLAGTEKAAGVAQAGGATAVARNYPEARPAAADEAVVLGVWDGDDAALARLREAGFDGLLLLDGCGGNVAAGAAYCESRVRAHRSKASKAWGGSMFASTSADVAPPSARNPRMWAQTQRQAREIMHESAKSRGLPPPNIKRNSVL